jgi:hypothetical protein
MSNTVEVMNDQDRVRLDKIEKTLEQLSNKLDKVFYAISGNDLDGNRGIVFRLEQVEDKLDDIDELITKTKWMAIGWAMALGLLGGGISTTIVSKLLM